MPVWKNATVNKSSKVHVVGLISLSWMSVLTNNSWVEQSEAFVHTEQPKSSMETAVRCGVECTVFRLTCDNCYHRVFLSFRTAFKWLLKESHRSQPHTLFLSWNQVDVKTVHCHTACSSNSLQSMLTSSPNSAWGQSAVGQSVRCPDQPVIQTPINRRPCFIESPDVYLTLLKV